MTQPTDDDRIREMIKRLDELQRESEAIRRRIDDVAAHSNEFPRPGDAASLFDPIDKDRDGGSGNE